jgi:hypothetical protein
MHPDVNDSTEIYPDRCAAEVYAALFNDVINYITFAQKLLKNIGQAYKVQDQSMLAASRTIRYII